jgi:two-component system invasion response regulator UvrY
MYNILVADEISIIRWGFKAIINEILQKDVPLNFASSGDEVLKAFEGQTYHLAVVDFNIAGETGLNLLQQMVAKQPQCNIIVSSKIDREYFLSNIMNMEEVKAFVCKRTSEEDFKLSIQYALQGKKYIPLVQQQILDKICSSDVVPLNPFRSLSLQEQKVAMLLLKGYGILEISNELEITSSTASTYKSRLFKKLQINNVIDLHNHANYYGFVPEEDLA